MLSGWVFLSCAVGAAGLATSQPAPRPLKVFVLAGQSNMLGRGVTSELPPDLRQAQPRALVFEAGQWKPLTPGETIGPEVSFAAAMVRDLDQEIGIIKLARDATNLAVDWAPDRPRSLYAQLLAQVQQARQSRPIELAGMAWMQGERDSRFEGMARAYRTSLARFIERCRRDFEAPRLPFVCGRINPPGAPYVDLVRQAQETLDAGAYAMVDCDDLRKDPDGLHYSAAGLVELGRRFAGALTRLRQAAATQPADG